MTYHPVDRSIARDRRFRLQRAIRNVETEGRSGILADHLGPTTFLILSTQSSTLYPVRSPLAASDPNMSEIVLDPKAVRPNPLGLSTTQKELLAGTVGGAAQVLVGQPFDLV